MVTGSSLAYVTEYSAVVSLPSVESLLGRKSGEIVSVAQEVRSIASASVLT